MKPDQPSSTVRTITTRVISEEEGKTPELWSYLAQVEQKNDWAKHIIYGYRNSPPPRVPAFKCQRMLVGPDNTQVAIFDQNEVEFALQRWFGGGEYQFLVKCGAQLTTRGTVSIDGPSKTITSPPSGNGTNAPGVILSSGDSTAAIAGKAIDTIAGQEHQAVNLGLGMMNTASAIVERFANKGNDAVMLEILAELRSQRNNGMNLTQILASVTSIIGIAKELGLIGGSGIPGISGELVGSFFKSAFERAINPQSSSAPTSTLGEALRVAPQIISAVAETARATADAEREKTQQLALTRTGMTAPRVASPQVIPPAMPPIAQPSTAPNGGNGAPSMDFVEKRIVEIFQSNVSAEQAADDAMTFLSNIDPTILDQLAAQGETGLLQFFGTRPNFKPMTANSTRLVDFIRAFLKMHAEDQAAAAKEQAAQAPLQN